MNLLNFMFLWAGGLALVSSSLPLHSVALAIAQAPA